MNVNARNVSHADCGPTTHKGYTFWHIYDRVDGPSIYPRSQVMASVDSSIGHGSSGLTRNCDGYKFRTCATRKATPRPTRDIRLVDTLDLMAPSVSPRSQAMESIGSSIGHGPNGSPPDYPKRGWGHRIWCGKDGRRECMAKTFKIWWWPLRRRGGRRKLRWISILCWWPVRDPMAVPPWRRPAAPAAPSDSAPASSEVVGVSSSEDEVCDEVEAVEPLVVPTGVLEVGYF